MITNHTKSLPALKGRGAADNPENRFEPLKVELEPDWVESAPNRKIETEYFIDSTKQILAKNTSPDISFDYSINPYRGCEHGCIYCYARPTHEYFGLSAGLDFETKIMVKKDAPALLEKAFSSSKWRPQVVAFSGNTDCYQPVERELQITRRCLEVFLKFRNPVTIITKNALILRDLDLLRELARWNLVRATVSVTTLDNRLTRIMEPRTSAPEKRLEALESLVKTGVPTNVNVAPVIPAINEQEMPQILKEAAARGVRSAAYILLRLPHSVKELFQKWLEEHFPERAKKVLHAVQDTRAGRLNDPCFSSRMSGEGARADAIKRMFELSCQKYGLNREKVELTTEHFRRGNVKQGQLF
ncbi:PA0069 family radical SAM protein [candidate division KSB1 bacterium]|nr:PA0069 family radical SAM protein [candidate division KSB1 bacterium]NIR69966.1 PA0069 family radical SAM protein [candidate division KSB1 bacterium]NIS25865.1 PA0069 family radical SAM protein [candidate division KSB1 bacterium]NIT72742.1 PA0069 family radical SAM protein [candidate division KSB1 bacterium]NIU26554.1 PA0069 family radical SAM protein [candidate division KSB1 bacterium]